MAGPSARRSMTSPLSRTTLVSSSTSSDFVVAAGLARGLVVVLQGLGLSLGSPQLVVVRGTLVGLLVSDDPADRGEDLLH